MGRYDNSYIHLWLKHAKTTPDDCGDVIRYLKTYRGWPGHFPNKTAMRNYLLAHLPKLVGERALVNSVINQLWAKYYGFYIRVRNGQEAA